ncbi:MAG: MG2 domain-containing protein [Chitinispirillia bacterium]|nr:MG2 domain-containing protein [Chitinispirillia bacterium]MCL2241983.1 MG2 domain-containing protein [Chitinispirillia bacterium]
MRFIKLLAVSAVLAGLFACDKQQQDTETAQDFSRYISGYTSGQVSTKAVIQVELAEERQQAEMGAEASDQLFGFSPSVKGKAYWKSSRLLEFSPDEPLKEGTTYNITFNLGKAVPGVEKKFQTFKFYVYTVEQNFSIRETFYKPVSDNQNRWNNMTVEVIAANALTDDEAQSAFQAKIGGKTMPSRLVNSTNGLNFRFLVDSLERTSENQVLKLLVSGGGKMVEKDISIHAVNTEIFQVVNTRNCEAPERCVQIVFTDPLAKQDLKGLIDLKNFETYTLKMDKNVVTIYPETTFPETISGKVSKNIRSFAGKKLADDFSFSIAKAPEVPVVRLLSSGNILPDSKNLLLAFSAVNLRAVEMRIIKIYEHNVLSFLQENSLSGSENLTRSGRLIAKKLLRLDQDKSKVLTVWNNFAVDISALVEKEPGAIYRFELIIRQPFSIYPCGGEDSQPSVSSQAAFDESNFTLTDADMDGWNSPHSYYSPVHYNYDEYEWSERENPCHASFYMQSDNTVVRTNLLATNVGVIAKKGEGPEMLVTAQDIRTTEPLSGSKVRVMNYQLAPIATGTTDRNGFCVLQVKTNEAFIVEVTHGAQKGYLKVSNGNELSLSRFDIGGKAIRKGLKGFIYGERGIWRPGDEIFMNFILEDRQKTIPAGHPVTVDIYNPQGQFFRKLVQTNPIGNFYSFNFKTDEQSPTGVWNAVISVGGVRFEKALRIETIKPNRLKINVDFGTELIETSRLKMAIGAKWLHGATAKDLGTKVILKLRPSPTAFKGYEGYNFNNPAAETYSYEEDIYSGYLDSDGHTEFTADLPEAEEAAGMLTATFTTMVEESGGGESITINSLQYSPFPAYAGLNVHQASEHEILSTDTTHYFDVALLNAKGKPVSGEVIYRAYRLGWSWWWDDDDDRENLSSVINGSHAKVMIDQKVTVKNGKARIPFKVSADNWGRYLIYIKDPKGGHATGRQIYADSPYWGGRSRDNDPQGLTMLTFTTDKKSYNVDEEVEIVLGKAGPGRALVSLENGSRTVKQWWELTRNQEPTKIKFKVTEDLAPNFYVHITMLQHHDQTLNDMPIRLYGVVPVSVVHPLGELKPVIKMPDVLRSENEFTVSVSETNRQQMTYTLAIVDEGLLDIDNFKTPNPYTEFNAKEALGVKTYDRYNRIVGAFSGELKPLFSIGGGEDLNNSADKNSQRFKPVVKFLGPFTLKAGATDQHKIQLPPYIGSVRVMVVAANDKQAYGRADKTVPVKNPLMVLTTLPRVLGPGEDVLMPVNVFVTEKSIRNVKVEVKSSDLLQLQEGASKSLTFSGEGDQMVYFKMKTKKQTGKVQVTIKAASGQETSSETINIEIRNPNPLLTVFESFIVKPQETREIAYEFDAEQPDNQVKMEYARIPSVNLSRTLPYLIAYPHGCSEQSTSKAFPQLYLHNFSNLSAKEKQDIQDNVNAVIKKLYTMQTAEGGISIWPGSSQADDWVTSYVGHFMAAAKDQGYSVSQSFVNDWKKYQKRRVSNWGSGSYTDDHQQAYRLYSLAMTGDPDISAMNRLRERPNLSQVSKWQLASAYAISGRKDAAKQLITNQSTQVAAYSAFNSNYGSSVRDEAIILETCILLDDMTQALNIARRISDYLNGGSYSTQTTAWALLAMARFADKSGKGNMTFTTEYLGKSNKVETPSPVHREDLAQLKRSGKVKVTNYGSGNIYIGRTMISTPLEDNSPAISSNLRILAGYEDLNGRTMSVNSLEQGSDFTADIRVTNTSGSTTYTNLALTHIIPSGWEIFNTRLSEDENSSSSSDGITYQDIRDDRVLSYFDLRPGQSKTISIRLQAAYLGRFFMPAVACQAMYDNTVYARTTGSWVEVVKE